MRLDDTGGHDKVRILDELLRETRDAVRRDRPEGGPLRRLAAIRVDDANTIDDRSKLLALLGLGRRAMKADADHDGDLGGRHATGVELVKEWRNENRIRGRAGEMGDGGDRARLLRRGRPA